MINMNDWNETWGTIDWQNDPENKIKQKITDFYHVGVDFNMRNKRNYYKTPLMYAAEDSSVGVVDLLIDGGADTNLKDEDNLTVLHWAIYSNDAEKMKCLLEHCPKNFENARDDGGWAPLHLAAKYGLVEIINVLIKFGADINIRKLDSRVPLHVATMFKRVEAVDVLLKHGADIEAKDRDGRTALHMAAYEGFTDVVKKLIEYGSDINMKDDVDQSVLHYAASNGSIEAAKILIGHGADVNAKNKEGKVPLDEVINSRFLPEEVALGMEDVFIHAKEIRAEYLKSQKVVKHKLVNKKNMIDKEYE